MLTVNPNTWVLLKDDVFFTWVSHPRVENPVGLLRPEGLFVVDATSQHLFAEGDNVRSFGQIKVLKCPHLAGWTSSCLNFVNHVGDVVS